MFLFEEPLYIAEPVLEACFIAVARGTAVLSSRYSDALRKLCRPAKYCYLFLLNPKTLNRYTGPTKEKSIVLREVINRISCIRWW